MVKTSWNGSNIKQLIEKGYTFTSHLTNRCPNKYAVSNRAGYHSTFLLISVSKIILHRQNIQRILNET